MYAHPRVVDDHEGYGGPVVSSMDYVLISEHVPLSRGESSKLGSIVIFPSFSDPGIEKLFKSSQLQ